MNELKRPWYLTTALVLIVLYHIINILSLILLPEGVSGYEIQVWYSRASVFFEVLIVIGLVSLFYWKKIGFYGALIVSLISIVVDYIAKPDFIAVATIGTLLPLVIVYLCMRPVMGNFK